MNAEPKLAAGGHQAPVYGHAFAFCNIGREGDDDRGLSQDDLAYEGRVSRSYFSQIEKSGFYAGLKIIERLAKA